jgi:hypothetical protein
MDTADLGDDCLEAPSRSAFSQALSAEPPCTNLVPREAIHAP